MKGTILTFSAQRNPGIISGEDGQRHPVSGPAWREAGAPERGDHVDVDVQGGLACDISLDPDAGPDTGHSAASGDKSKVEAGLFAILLGELGMHKLYLAYTMPAVIALVVTVGSFPLTCGGSAIAVGVIGLVEGIICLTKSNEQFQETYVNHRRAWP